MKTRKSLLCAAAAAAIFAFATEFAGATGYALYETGARGNAMGGSLIGSTRDASAVYFNPANMGETTNVCIMAGATFINPFHDLQIDGQPRRKMNAGWFTIPHAYVTMPLPGGFSVGLGEYSEYGVGTKYKNNWRLANDSYETTVMQVTTSPVLSYQVTDKWSVGAGARISWLQFETCNRPYWTTSSALGMAANRAHVKGDDVSAGFILATQYKLLDNLRAGVVYRSPIHHRLHGNFDLDMNSAFIPGAPYHLGTKCRGKVELPQSIQLGLNWDITERWRAGASVTWTRWSALDRLTIKVPTHPALTHTTQMNWHDVWRFGFGTEYDLLDWMCVRGSYQYDMDPSSELKGATMMSAGHRSLIGSGLGFDLGGGWTLDVGYTLIIQDAVTRYIYDDMGAKHRFQTHNAFSHIVSASVGYSF